MGCFQRKKRIPSICESIGHRRHRGCYPKRTAERIRMQNGRQEETVVRIVTFWHGWQTEKFPMEVLRTRSDEKKVDSAPLTRSWLVTKRRRCRRVTGACTGWLQFSVIQLGELDDRDFTNPPLGVILHRSTSEIKNRSPKGNIWSAIPVALLSMIGNWSERKLGSGSQGDEVL